MPLLRRWQPPCARYAQSQRSCTRGRARGGRRARLNLMPPCRLGPKSAEPNTYSEPPICSINQSLLIVAQSQRTFKLSAPCLHDRRLGSPPPACGPPANSETAKPRRHPASMCCATEGDLRNMHKTDIWLRGSRETLSDKSLVVRASLRDIVGAENGVAEGSRRSGPAMRRRIDEFSGALATGCSTSWCESMCDASFVAR